MLAAPSSEINCSIELSPLLPRKTSVTDNSSAFTPYFTMTAVERKRAVKAVATVFSITTLLIAIALIAASLNRLDSTEMGVSYDRVRKILSLSVEGEGLYLGPVGFTFIKAPSVFKTVKTELTCLNKDGIQIRVSMAYQYKIRHEHFRNILMQFKDVNTFQTLLQFVGAESVYEVCAEFWTSEIQEERGRFTKTIRDTIKRHFDELNVDVSGVQISNYGRPHKFEAAIEIKERAREDIQVAERERNKKLVVGNTTVLVAEAEGRKIKILAESYARIKNIEAENAAKTITAEFEAEITTYNTIKSLLNLTVEGILSYMGIRLLEKSPNQVNIAVENPAKFSYGI